MDIGIPKERRPDENRVALTPAGVSILVESGHRVFVEASAGAGSGYPDQQYINAGAQIVYSDEEAWGRGALVLKVGRPLPEELERLDTDQILAGFLHLAAGKRQKIQTIVRHEATALAWELVQRNGDLCVLAAISEIAGHLAPQIAARLLENQYGGKGILLAGLPGVPPAEVVIIGAGNVGRTATNAFLEAGATVYVLDIDLNQLRQIAQETHGRAITMLSNVANLRKALAFADVVVGAILVQGARTPQIISREMLRSMKPRSIIIDYSIDQGGCLETSRPTALHDPSYVEEGVIHWCVPNATGAVSRTATHALTNVTLPYIQAIADHGLARALEFYPELRNGVLIQTGRIVSSSLTELVANEEVL